MSLGPRRHFFVFSLSLSLSLLSSYMVRIWLMWVILALVATCVSSGNIRLESPPHWHQSMEQGLLMKVQTIATWTKGLMNDIGMLTDRQKEVLFVQCVLMTAIGFRQGIILLIGDVLMHSISQSQCNPGKEPQDNLETLHARLAVVLSPARGTIKHGTDTLVNICVHVLETVVGTRYKRVAVGTILLSTLSWLTGWKTLVLAQIGNLFNIVNMYLATEGFPDCIRKFNLPVINAL